MLLPLAVPAPLVRSCRLIALALAVLVCAPALRGGMLFAQACRTDNPPCPPPPAFSVDLTVASDTVHATTVSAYFVVQGITYRSAATVTMTVNGTGVPLQWQYL